MGSTPHESLGALENAVLSALWSAQEPLSVRAVWARLARRPPLAYTTVLTVLDRLHDKALVLREKDGKAFLYRPVMSRDEWVGERAARVLTESPASLSEGVLLAFLDSAERTDPEVVARLSALIAARRGARRS
ncbi:MAG: BlaI/MecI/CopY family transcriptional regulator [Myxococcales bacterium]|nr:BlaI/MecI/CopY family transcriptional regulator [Myxococcales bacterium]